MLLWINGQERQAPDLDNVDDLARWLELPAFGSAVELNGKVIRKAEYLGQELREGDRLEVVRLVGGG
jgi:thiamine biosynthesis protein ThiS